MVDIKEGLVRGDVSSLDGKSKEDVGEELLEQESDCLCLRPVRMMFIRFA